MEGCWGVNNQVVGVITIVVAKMDAREVVIGLEVCANIFIFVSH